MCVLLLLLLFVIGVVADMCVCVGMCYIYIHFLANFPSQNNDNNNKIFAYYLL